MEISGQLVLLSVGAVTQVVNGGDEDDLENFMFELNLGKESYLINFHFLSRRLDKEDRSGVHVSSV